MENMLHLMNTVSFCEQTTDSTFPDNNSIPWSDCDHINKIPFSFSCDLRNSGRDNADDMLLNNWNNIQKRQHQSLLVIKSPAPHRQRVLISEKNYNNLNIFNKFLKDPALH